MLDPFAGSGTTLLAAAAAGAESVGIEAHPFVARIARAKLTWRSDPDALLSKAKASSSSRGASKPSAEDYPKLIRACYDKTTLNRLDALRRWSEHERDDSAASELVWLALVSSLRRASRANTARWRSVLPKKSKKTALDAFRAFDETMRCSTPICELQKERRLRSRWCSLQTRARVEEDPDHHDVNLVVTSPPYPNNYDYADATRLEMSFMREIDGWGDLQDAVRKYLIRSCSQHVPERQIDLETILSAPELAPIADKALPSVKNSRGFVRQRGGAKRTTSIVDRMLLQRSCSDLAGALARVRRQVEALFRNR